ncbi:MAG: HAD family hydrolase [Sphaerochaetaceae bacterium]|nr:HAD family hydrolase [Sphaerochaetaceae bacterium]
MGFVSDTGIKAILLDVDGTLYPKRMLDLRMLRSMFPSLVVAAQYNRMRRRIRQVQEQEPTVPPTLEGFRRRQAEMILGSRCASASEKDYVRIERRLECQFYDRWPRYFASIKPFPGMRAALAEAHSLGLRLGVLSDFPVADKLKTLGVEDLVEYACCAEESGYLKPHSAPFMYILEHMGLSPREVLFIGDSYDKDIEGASRIGMHTCLLKSGFGGGRRTAAVAMKKYPSADLVCGSWLELSERVLRS